MLSKHTTIIKRAEITRHKQWSHDDRPADHLYNPGVLITGALQSFPPGGHIIKEVLHLHTVSGNC